MIAAAIILLLQLIEIDLIEDDAGDAVCLRSQNLKSLGDAGAGRMGYVGLAFLLVFIIVILHAIGRVADRDPLGAARALTCSLYYPH